MDDKWTKIGANINGERAFDEFGHSIAMNAAGTRVIIGSAFVRFICLFVLLDVLIILLIYQLDQTVIAKCYWCLVLCNQNSDVITENGHGRVFEDIDGTWTQVGEDIDGDFLDQLGLAVAMNADGKTVALGGPGVVSFFHIFC